MPLNNIVLHNVKLLCAKKKINLAILERNSGLTNGAIGKWKKSKPQLESVVKVAKCLKVSVDRLLREPEEGNNAN